MRGYYALILVDVSRQGGEPGTLYVIEPDPDEIKAGIEDGEVINPHGMDPQTVLRFVKTIGGWPGKVVVVACEPAVVEELGLGCPRRSRPRVERGVELVLETLDELATDAAEAAARGGGGVMHELSIAPRSSTPRSATPRAGGSPSSTPRLGRLRQVVPTRSPSTSRSSRATPSARALG